MSELTPLSPIQIQGDTIGLGGSGKGFWNGSFVEPFDALITSDGSTITMTL